MALALAVSELRAQEPLIVKLSVGTDDFSFGTQDGYDVSGRLIQTVFSEEREAGF